MSCRYMWGDEALATPLDDQWDVARSNPTPKSKRPKAAVARVLRPPVELRRPELAEVGLGGVVARGIRECA